MTARRARSQSSKATKASDSGAPDKDAEPAHLWLNPGDREDIFHETAGSATSTGIPYWLVLLLAGAIAELGLSLDSAAVVIGAMLIAPLLAPIVGLALALAVGDSRLAIRTAIVIAASTLGVIAVAALLTFSLPFHTLTDQISARTRPNMLDLAIAVFSGLAGAVVTVARGKRLSGTVPGVAISVALVPPLAAAGFGIGSGWNWTIIRGSLLLYGANLAGIVMSAMVMFLIVGMHHSQVLSVATAWHREKEGNPEWAWLGRIPGIRSLGILASPWARVALVLAFVALVGVPLNSSLRQITREAHVRHAIDVAEKQFTRPGRSFIVSSDITLGDGATQVALNVATTSWFTDAERTNFEKNATRLAHEPVTLVLEQLPASTGDVANFTKLLGSQKTTRARGGSASTGGLTSSLPETSASIGTAVDMLALPDSVAILDYEVVISGSTAPPEINLVYLAPDSLTTQTVQIITRQLRQALQSPSLLLNGQFVQRERRMDPRSIAAVDSVATMLTRYHTLAVRITAGADISATRLDSMVVRIRRAAGDSARVVVARNASRGATLLIRLDTRTRPTPPGPQEK
ncbi:MAG: DUF389 domain-containing protein [Gemmatimonadaceae bacterium]